LEPRGSTESKSAFHDVRTLMCALRYGGCARETSSLSGFAQWPGFQPAYSCLLFAWNRMGQF